MQNKKILMFCRLFWPHGGGVEKHVEMLSEELLSRGHEITIVTEQHDLDLPLEETYKGIRVIRIPYFAAGSKRLVWTWMRDHEQLIDAADLIHIHDVFWWYWPSRIAQLFKPVYMTFHGYEGNNPPTTKAIMQRKAAETAARGSICVGDFMRKWYLATPEIVTYGAAEITLSRKAGSPLKRETLRSDEAVFWGRFDDDTGIYMYVEALEKLTEIKRLRVFGDGPYKPMLEAAQLKTKKLQIRPWNKNVKVILGNSRYAFVSRYLSIIEAMQAQRLVVAVYNNEIKKDYLMCHPMCDSMIIAGSVDELVSKLQSLSMEKIDRMVRRSYDWAKIQTWDKMADDYEHLWQK